MGELAWRQATIEYTLGTADLSLCPKVKQPHTLGHHTAQLFEPSSVVLAFDRSGIELAGPDCLQNCCDDHGSSIGQSSDTVPMSE